MNIFKLLKLISAVPAAALLITSCSKKAQNTDRAKEDLDLSNVATVQLYNVAVGNQRNYVYVDGKAVTGAALAYTTAAFTPLFPTSGSGFAVQPGLRSFLIRDTAAVSTQPPLAFPQSVDPSKNYTVFLYDTMTAIKQKTVETVIERPSDSSSRVRFANFALAPGGAPAVDLYSKRFNITVFSSVGYTDVTNYIPYASSWTSTSLADTLFVREAGNTTTNLDTMVFNPAAKFSYTLIFRGRYATNGAAGGTYPRTLSSFVNY
jgi:hypothetical protein